MTEYDISIIWGKELIGSIIMDILPVLNDWVNYEKQAYQVVDREFVITGPGSFEVYLYVVKEDAEE